MCYGNHHYECLYVPKKSIMHLRTARTFRGSPAGAACCASSLDEGSFTRCACVWYGRKAEGTVALGGGANPNLLLAGASGEQAAALSSSSAGSATRAAARLPLKPIVLFGRSGREQESRVSQAVHPAGRYPDNT